MISVLRYPVDSCEKLVERGKGRAKTKSYASVYVVLLFQHMPSKFQSSGLTGIRQRAFLGQFWPLVLLFQRH